MPIISNVNNLADIQNKRVFRKLSLKPGETFNARVTGISDDKSEVVLKYNGWSFYAQIDDPVDLEMNQYSKFAVQGYEDGKLKLQITSQDDKRNIDSEKELKDILSEYSEDSSEENLSILKSLFEHYIPLTKDNVLLIKTILDFKKSISKKDSKDDLISKYLKIKKIDENSDLGKSIKEALKNYINELSEVDIDEIATLMENGIELTGENINSFKNIVYKDNTIFNILNNLEEKNLNDANMMKEVTNDILTGKGVSSKLNSEISNIKNIINNLIVKNDELVPILQPIKEKLNDFKVYNEISKNYYYIDVPIKFNSDSYNFRLIIKDDRKSGKKIDSQNAKIAVSIETVNMGSIDLFFSFLNKKVDIDINIEKKFVGLLKATINYISQNIEGMGFATRFDINEKEQSEKLNLVNCRSFFNDKIKAKLDVKV